MVICPECGSLKNWKDGLRYIDNGTVQRWLCRSCGYRFSEPRAKVNIRNEAGTFDSSSDLAKTSVGMRNFSFKKSLNDCSFSRGKDVVSHGVTDAGKGLNNLRSYDSKCRISVSLAEGTKNLVKVETRTEAALRESNQNTKGLLVSLSFWMLKEGYRESTIYATCQRLKHLIKLGANLLDQESIKDVIARQKWQEGTKLTYVNAYARLCKIQGIQFDKPRYRASHNKLPFIPIETELDQLIAGCSRKMSVFLQLLKETGMRSGEATKVEWKHLDFVTKNVRVNNPEKHGNTRILRISDKVISMLKALPQESNKVFSGSVHGIRSNFTTQRRRVAQKLKNPRINRISFHTFRHWKATMTYHKTKDILYVKKILGHKSINSTLLYTQLISFEGDEYDVKVAENKQEIVKLLEAGFEWIGKDNDGLTYFRKRK